MTYDKTITRLKEVIWLLKDKQTYPLHSWKRRKLLMEYNILKDMLISDKS